MRNAHAVNHKAFVHYRLPSCLKNSPVKAHEAWKQPSGSGCLRFVEGTEKNLVCFEELASIPWSFS